MSRLLKFTKLPAEEKILFTKAFFLVTAVRLVLWLIPFKLLQKSLAGSFLPETETRQTDWEKIKNIVRAVRSVSRVVPAATCLTQALAASLLIRSCGEHSELKIGVAKDEQARFQAHAWLETDGRIIIGKLPEHKRFMVLNFSGEKIL